MNAWMAPAIGTALGLSLAAAAAALVLPEKPMIDLAPLVQRWLRPAPPAPVPAPPPQPAIAPPAPVPPPQAAAPRAVPGLAPVAPLPAPAPPAPAEGIEGLLRRPPAGWGTGTGFFVDSRGTLLTAEHVVRGCGVVRVMSAHMRPAQARVVALDAEADVAVLEVPGLSSPAWLPVAAPARAPGRLAALGFPAGALPDTPNETWAAAVNAAFPANSRWEADPRRVVWFRSGEITHGYSGGPLVDLGSGRVVGMVRGGIDHARVPSLDGVPTQGLGLGPGAAPMLAMLSRFTVREGVVPAGMGVESALEMTRRATVRVVCTK
jgi:S1-C subfamily serine protease